MKLIMRRLQQAGYRVDAKIYDALEFGLPQKRRRVYIVGLHEDEHIQRATEKADVVQKDLVVSLQHKKNE